MKQIVMGLDRIESLAKKMIDTNQSDDDRAITFAAIKVIVDKLDEINEELNNGNGYASEKIGNIHWHSQSISHLDDGNNHSDNQHLAWLRRAISATKSDNALGPIIEE